MAITLGLLIENRVLVGMALLVMTCLVLVGIAMEEPWS